MAGKVRPFALEMKEGVHVRSITELKDNFDIEKVVGYFLDGKLKKWLDARYYEEELAAIEQLNEDDPLLSRKLCELFDVKCVEESVNTEEIAERNARISRLKQYTDDEEIIKNVDSVAFNQEELAELYDKGVEKIYLCEGEFKIPKSKEALEYIEVGTVKIINKKRKTDVPDTFTYEVKKRYIFDKKIEKIQHLDNGELYNIEVNSIIKKNLNNGNEEVITTDEEDVTQLLVNGDNLLYVVNDRNVYYRKNGTCSMISKNNLKNGDNKLCYVDDTKAIWFTDNTYYLSDYSGDELVIISSRSHNNSLIELVTIDSSYAWFLTVKNNKLLKVNLSERKSEVKIVSGASVRFLRRESDFKTELIQTNVWYAKKRDDYIYTYVVESSSKDKFYRISMSESVPEYIADGSASYASDSFEAYVRDFEVYNQEIIYIASKFFDKCRLCVLNLENRTTRRLDENLPSLGSLNYELYVTDEWIYYGATNFVGEYEIKFKIKHNGKDKQKVTDNVIFKTKSIYERTLI